MNYYVQSQVAQCIPELLKLAGKSAYILLVDDVIYAATSKMSMDDFLGSDESIVSAEEGVTTDTQILYGLVIDANDLPYEISDELMKEKSIYILQCESSTSASVVVDTVESLEMATAVIQASLDGDDGMDIDDFVVVIGEELSLHLQTARAGNSLTVHQLNRQGI